MVIRKQRFSSNQVRSLAACWGRICTPRVVFCDATLACCGKRRLAAVCTIGQGPAAARAPEPCHFHQTGGSCLLPEIKAMTISSSIGFSVVGARSSIVVALDWTDFDLIARSPLLSLINYGRATQAWYG